MVGTCEICYQVFEKPKGIPSLGTNNWVCSEKCKTQVKPRATQDEVLEINFESNLKKQAEIEYQNVIRQQAEDVDLDFNYKYN